MRRPLFTERIARFERLYKGEKMSDKFITRDEALKELGLTSPISLRRLVLADKITASKINSKIIYYSLQSIRAYKSGKSAQTI